MAAAPPLAAPHPLTPHRPYSDSSDSNDSPRCPSWPLPGPDRPPWAHSVYYTGLPLLLQASGLSLRAQGGAKDLMDRQDWGSGHLWDPGLEPWGQTDSREKVGQEMTHSPVTLH